MDAYPISFLEFMHVKSCSCENLFVVYFMFTVYKYLIMIILVLNIIIILAAKPDRVDSKHKTLGEQAMNLKTQNDRQMALRRITSTMQVQLARSMVMKVLSVLAGR